MADIIKDFNSDEVSQQLLNNVTNNLDFSVPSVDLTEPEYSIPEDILDSIKNFRPSVKIEDLTSTEVDGAGVFDKMMTSIRNHLKEEFEEGRITGAEYTNAYITLSNTVLQTAVNFTLNKDKAQLEAYQGMVNAYTSVVSNATAKVALATAQAQAHTQRAQYANMVLQLATQDVQFATALEQMEAARSQTSDTKSDGTPITGSIKRQNDLVETQRESFLRKNEMAYLKVLSDWIITAKTQDTGLETPAGLQNSDITATLNTVKSKLNI